MPILPHAALRLVELPYKQAEVLVATTWECNLRCSYCFVQKHSLKSDGDYMSPDLAVRLIDALDEGMTHVEKICIHLYGGESLINLPAIEAMLNRSQEKGAGRFSFAITTNGTCISDSAIDLLGAGRFHVILSIDGPPVIHDKHRRTTDGSPTHSIVMQFLRKLRSHTNCSIRGSAVISSGWRLLEATEYLRTLPVDFIKAQVVRLPPGSPYALSKEEKYAYMEDLETIGLQVVNELEAGKMPRDDRFSSRVLQLLKGERRQSFCGAGNIIFGINPRGDVFPCILIGMENNILGNVKDDPQNWIQAGQRWRTSRSLRKECKACSFLHLCGGGCPALISVCGANECDFIRKNCEVAVAIFDHFRSNQEALLALAGIT